MQPSRPVNTPGPPGEYITKTHVPVLKEHSMDNGPNGVPEYVGPAELQEIANNNNKRVRQTGDATPLVVGHTVDGDPEDEQPEIVGYATNFYVAPLFETGQMALHADFHIRREERDRVNKFFPRRSVEYWPRRREIDPISLLGATTPEQDLGLIQFSRNGRRYERASVGGREVIRYNRRGDTEYGYRLIFEDASRPILRKNVPTNMTERPHQYAKKKQDDDCRSCQCSDRGCPCCKGKCKSQALMFVHRTDMDDAEGTPMCEGCAADALDSGVFQEGHSLASVQRKKQSPFKPNNMSESPKRNQRMAGHSYPTPQYVTLPYRTNGSANGNNSGPRRYAMGGMDGGAGDVPDEATARMVEAVLQSAPIQELVQNGQQTKSQLDEIMQLLQSQQGGPADEQGGGGMPPEQMGGGEQGPPPEGGEEEGAGGPAEEARWMHEPHDGGTAEAHDGPPEQYMDGEDEDPEQYAENGYGASQYATDGDYTMDDDEESAAVKPHGEARRYDASYASADNDYIPSQYYKPRAGHMGGHHGGIHPGSKRRHSRATAEGATQQHAQQPQRTKSQFDLYMESLRGGDEKVRYSRLEQMVKQQQEQLRELALDKRRYAREKALRDLQLEGVEMEVAEEMERTLPLDDAQFAKEVAHIKVRFRRDTTAIGVIRTTDFPSANGQPPRPPEATMSHDEVVKYSRRLGDTMMQLKRKNPEVSDAELTAMARTQLQKTG